MSSWSAELKRREAAQRREERAAKRRQRELERHLKERAKLSEMEQARLEVEQYENFIEVLLSVQKDRSEPIDWIAFVSALPPHDPPFVAKHEFAASLNRSVAWNLPTREESAEVNQAARSKDARDHALTVAEYHDECIQWQRMRSLASRVIEGRLDAYSEAFHEFSTLGEISSIGSSIDLNFHSAKLVDCKLQVKGRDVIPAEIKSLTAAGKLSCKVMPKTRFHEIYQDYVCGCAFRLAREMFALLPLDTALVTVSVDEGKGRNGILQVLSVAFTREAIEKLDFAHLDASDAMEGFLHRGDAKASRKSGEFVPIIPLIPGDLAPDQPKSKDIGELLVAAHELRDDISAVTKKLAERLQSPEPVDLTV